MKTKKTPKLNLDELTSIKIYDLMKKLNEDIFEDILITNQKDKNEADILMLFKQFGKELGIGKKYLFVHTKKTTNDNIIHIDSNSVSKKLELSKNYEEITSNYLELVVKNNEDYIDINYKFDMNINEDLPLYMENLIGFLMKKVFYRLKLFIESIY